MGQLEVIGRQERHGKSAPPRRALFFFDGSFTRQTDGCHVRAAQTLDLMVACGLAVVVYSYRQHPAWPWRAEDEAEFARRYPTVELVLDDGGYLVDLLARTKRRLSLLGPRMRQRVLRRGLPGLTPRLDELKARNDIDVVLLSYAAGTTQLNGLPVATTIIDIHDVTSLERVRLQSPGDLNLATLRALKSEIGLLGMADVVWSISYAEFWFLQELLEGVRVRFVPPVFAPAPSSPDIKLDHDLLFIGSDNRWNTAALADFLDSYATWKNQVTLAVAGKVCLDPRVRERAAAMSGVTLLGYQPDLAALYERARATICPVEGTGTKIKLVESLAYGRPVFVAAGSTRGLSPGYEQCVFPLNEGSVSAVLKDPKTLDEAWAACRTYAEAYSFENVRRTVNEDFTAPDGHQLFLSKPPVTVPPGM